MFLLVPAHPGFPGQIPQSRKTVVCVCVFQMNFFAHACSDATARRRYRSIDDVIIIGRRRVYLRKYITREVLM